MTKLHVCSWCGLMIVQSAYTKTITRNGRAEYYHYHHGKDCLADKVAALNKIRYEDEELM